jgi:2-polyprenyl-3-methyl-5-hydroxy-6-metoxy-1,4-benzoquinol methylase
MSIEGIRHSGVQTIAFYLPQFYPFPENDQWWGKGFTEWTNVTKASPLFKGHYQPHLPTDLGFYDLRLRETRHEQAQTAKRYGISAFCYHYYWFSGKRLLDAPLDAMLHDPALEMPFCLCWANENWTRRWDAAEHEILIAQDYSAQNDAQFVQDLLPYFDDSRYLRIGSSPFFVIYRAQQIPDLPARLGRWRESFLAHGFDVHFCAALTHGNEDYMQLGFDSGVEFPPHNLRNLKVPPVNKKLEFNSDFHGIVVEFGDLAEAYMAREYSGDTVFKCVVPSWDNAARRNDQALVVLNGTPNNFELWLRQAYEYTSKSLPAGKQLLFVNAWNEWAEGCHLEPDRLYGRRFLEAVDRVRAGRSNITAFARTEPGPVAATVSSALSAAESRASVPANGRSVSWKLKRELRRLGLQLAQRRLRVDLEAGGSGLQALNPVNGRNAATTAFRRSTPNLNTFMNYEYKVDLEGDSAAAQVIKLVGKNKKVLEIGAGSGSITKHLVNQNNCKVSALEINPNSIDKLRSYTADIYDLDLNDSSWTTELQNAEPFDCVVAADVLEHLYDPWRVLGEMKSLLVDGGTVVLSLPHAGHCTVLGCLFQEDLEYQEWGLLDKTHVRFFGIHNIQALLEGAGLSLVDARWVLRHPNQTEFAHRWNSLPSHVQRALSENPFSNVYQVVTKATQREHAVKALQLHEFAKQTVS